MMRLSTEIIYSKKEEHGRDEVDHQPRGAGAAGGDSSRVCMLRRLPGRSKYRAYKSNPFMSGVCWHWMTKRRR